MNIGRVPNQGHNYVFLSVALAFLALQAYEVLNIPIEYYALVSVAAYAFMLLSSIHKATLSVSLWLWLLLALYTMNIMVVVMQGDYVFNYTFIVLRYFDLITFIFILFLGGEVAKHISVSQMINLLVPPILVIVMYSYWTYFAQMYNLPEVPRNRLGTGGQDFLKDAVDFQYGFRRFVGTFREPGHYAQFMIVPILLLWHKRNTALFIFVFLSILLTGSVAGLFSLLFSISLYELLRGNVYRARLALFLVILFFSSLAIYRYSIFEEFNFVLDRVFALFELGVMESNRGDVFRYMTQGQITLLGGGLGAASEALRSSLGWSVAGSFYGLIWFLLMSVGLLGLLAFMGFLLHSTFRVSKSKFLEKSEKALYSSLNASFLIAYLVNSESFILYHAFFVGYFNVRSSASKGLVAWKKQK